MARKTKRKMFIAVLPGEMTEVAIAEESQVQEYYVELSHQQKTKGDIYKGTIHNVDTSLQAAFINYGAEKNGFLQIDEVHPEYYRQPHDNPKHRYPLIQKVLKPGQEILVQVVKEPVGSKGAFLTSYLSLPGRYVVITPGRDLVGVSRKVEDEKERERLKSIIDTIKFDPGVGCIVRTASIGQSKTRIVKDVQVLRRQWKEVRDKGRSAESPSLIYREPDLANRAIRDYLTEDIGEVWVDDEATHEELTKFAAVIYPRRPTLVKLHTDPDTTLWERFNMTKQIEQIYTREVTLPSGGRLVFDQTEALMAVDINSGKIGGKTNFQEMAYRTNLEAASAICQHLKLRDIGGQIVVDFIEMRDPKQIREVEKVMRQAMKNDRARHDVGKMSKFGLLQIVRQRMGTSALSVSTEPCPCCKGSGMRRNMEWQSLQALKEIHRLLRKKNGPDPVEFPCPSELAHYLLNQKREMLYKLERAWDKGISISGE